MLTRILGRVDVAMLVARSSIEHASTTLDGMKLCGVLKDCEFFT